MSPKLNHFLIGSEGMTQGHVIVGSEHLDYLVSEIYAWVKNERSWRPYQWFTPNIKFKFNKTELNHHAKIKNYK